MHTATANTVPRALIFSYSDSCVYFVGTTFEPQGESKEVTFFKDEQGNLLKFRNLYQAKAFFARAGFFNGWLVMHSAYDEMVGNEKGQTAELPWICEVAVA